VRSRRPSYLIPTGAVPPLVQPPPPLHRRCCTACMHGQPEARAGLALGDVCTAPKFFPPPRQPLSPPPHRRVGSPGSGPAQRQTPADPGLLCAIAFSCGSQTCLYARPLAPPAHYRDSFRTLLGGSAVRRGCQRWHKHAAAGENAACCGSAPPRWLPRLISVVWGGETAWATRNRRLNERLPV